MSMPEDAKKKKNDVKKIRLEREEDCDTLTPLWIADLVC